MSMQLRQHLPIDVVLAPLTRALGERGVAVLQAPPGAGKTTRVPLALLGESWLAGRKIIMLEPRRLAARAAARYMAASLGEEVGATVGYRVRMDSRVGNDTRIEVVTEGILTRMLQSDAELPGVGAVIFDEFHERSVHADLGLALCLQSRAVLRNDLRLLVMSATLDGDAVARLMGDAPLLTSAGRSYPVEIRYGAGARPALLERRSVSAQVTQTVLRALQEEHGSVLVFLPGAGEIKDVARRLGDTGIGGDVHIVALYGELDAAAQDLAIRPATAGQRKVVLATNIAETSLTIDGIRIVVDAGLARVAVFDAGTGMTRMRTVAVSQASAAQRCGRAGRLYPGVCYRLWSEQRQQQLQPFNTPEIMQTDLAPLALELALWGARVDDLAWLDPPPAASFAQARELMTTLGALDGQGRISAHGRRMATLAMHPRLAHMVLHARRLGAATSACELAALLGERDILRGNERDCDIAQRIGALRGDTPSAAVSVERAALARVQRVARQCQRQIGGAASPPSTPAGVGLLLALAYPERVAQRRVGADNRFLLANGRGAYFAQAEPLAACDYIVVAHLDAGQREARVFLAAEISRAELIEHFSDRIESVRVVRWDAREKAVIACNERRYGELTLTAEALVDTDVEQIRQAMLDGVRALGIDALPWTRELRTRQQRLQFVRRLQPDSWPDVSDQALLESVDQWLAPFLDGIRRASHLPRMDLDAAFGSLLSWPQQRALDELAPTHITVPSGSRVAIDYSCQPPALAVRVQEMFGATDTPCIGGGCVPLMLQLLSPARRPVQVTQDLASFWADAYHQVKKDLKGRYPKHYWPDDPFQAVPTGRTKPRH